MMRTLNRPEPGFWLVRQTRGGPPVPACIRREEAARDPDFAWNDMTGTRSPFLAAYIAGEVVSLDAVWLWRGQEITAEEYAFRLADLRHAQEYRLEDPLAAPHRKVNLAKAEPIYRRENQS